MIGENKKKNAIICDIDGCLLNTEKIFEEILQKKLKGDKKWDYFHKFANEPSHAIKNTKLIEFLICASKNNYEILLVTARNEVIYKETFRYLYDNKDEVFDFKLFCRKYNDYRPAWIVKEEITKKLLKEYNITIAIDDEISNCQMFESLGILTVRFKWKYAELSQQI